MKTPRRWSVDPLNAGMSTKPLRLLLTGPNGPPTDDQVLDFATFAVHRDVDVSSTWVAMRGTHMDWALLPIISPGKTMLLISPTRLPRKTPVTSAITLSRLVLDHYTKRDIQLAQLLLDPNQPEVRDLYRTSGFTALAELIYLNRTVKRHIDAPLPGDRFELKTYSAATHSLFADAISRSYVGSLDCPALTGMRDMIDVIEGHKSAGEFDPRLWFVLLERGAPIAVLLLSPATNGSVLELIYLGLVPSARGRGIGDAMMQHAIATVANESRNELSLAVDSRNEPAMKLYFRHGMKRVGHRLAMLADLRHPLKHG